MGLYDARTGGARRVTPEVLTRTGTSHVVAAGRNGRVRPGLVWCNR